MPQRTTHARNNKHSNKQRTRNSPSSSNPASEPSSPPLIPVPVAEEEEGQGPINNALTETERGTEDIHGNGHETRLIDLSSSPSPQVLPVSSNAPGSDLLALLPLEVGLGALSLGNPESVPLGGGEADTRTEAEEEDEELEATYRSPPFRQLSLPGTEQPSERRRDLGVDGSPPPLPVRVRGAEVSIGDIQREPVSVRPSFPHSHSRSHSVASSASGSSGLRPNIPTTTTSGPTISGLSAYMRGPTIPSGVSSTSASAPTPPPAPAVPPAMLVGTSASATPPLVSRPAVSLGVFSGAGGGGGHGVTRGIHQEFERDYEREHARGYDAERHQDEREDGDMGPGYGYGHASPRSAVGDGYGYGYLYGNPNRDRDRRSDAHTYGYGYPQDDVPRASDVDESRYGYGGRADDKRVSSPVSVSGGHGMRSSRGAREAKEREAKEREREVRMKELEIEREREREKERKANANRILWAKWDVVDDDRRILTLAYPSSIQIWDTSDLRSIKEVMNVHFDSEEWGLVLGMGGQDRGRDRRLAEVRERGRVGGGGGGGGGKGPGLDVRVVDARVLPRPTRIERVSGRRKGGGTEGRKDQFEDVRPVVGILLETVDEIYPVGMDLETEGELEMEPDRKTFFVVYSLRTHQVVKMLGVNGRGEAMNVSGDVVVLSTSNPPTLHILLARTLEVVYVVPASALQAFVRPSPAHPRPLAHAPSSSSTGMTTTIVSPSPSSAGFVGSAPSGLSLSIANAITSTLSSAAEMGKAIGRSTNTATPSVSERSMDSPDYNQQGFHSPDDHLHPKPVFALSGRLLAYASPAPSSNGSSSGSSPVDQISNASPTPSSLLSNLSRGMGNRMGLGMTRRFSSSSSASGVSGLSVGGGSNTGNGNSASSSPFGSNGGGLGRITGMTQADVGSAALRVGESVFSGVKFLGGVAFGAARSRVGGGSGSGSRERDGGSRVVVSRSVPDTPDVDEVAARMLRERRYSHVPSSSMLPSTGNTDITTTGTTTTTVVMTPHTKTSAEHGHYVTVLDLAPLFHNATSHLQKPRKIDEFNASRSQPVAGLRFSQDGTSVGVITRDGHSVKVFKLFPAPSVVASQAVDPDDQETEAALERLRVHRPASQTYDLYRGRTSAVVEDVTWAKDGRWVALGTRNRTVHIFATNPYGGKPDLKSHLDGRVKGDDVIEHQMTGLTALAKIRCSKSLPQRSIAPPLAFMFLSPNDVLSSPDLIAHSSTPSSTTSQHPSSSYSPSSPKFPAPTISSTNTTLANKGTKRSRNYQDVLLFDPATGVLSLHRLVLDKHPVREGVVAAATSAAAAMGVGSGATKMKTSVSFPGMGVSSSPRADGGDVGGMRAKDSSQKVQDAVQMELGAKETVMATWDLRRATDRAEIRVPIHPKIRTGQRNGQRDWLSQGEITTSSTSQHVLPRSIYLSHQFTFHTLGEDYHALIRRHQLDGIVGRKVEVRIQVEISSGGGKAGRELGADDGFIEEFQASSTSPQPHAQSLSHGSHSLSHPHAIQRVSSSFDEPIASAISGTFFDDFDLDDPNSNHYKPFLPHSPIHLPPILPMYPNGVPGIRGGVGSAGSGTSRKAVAAATSIRNVISNAIPIRGIGVSSGVSRRFRYKSIGGSGAEGEGVPLEFDEEDEDFVGGIPNPSVEVEASTATIVPVHQFPHEVEVEGGDVVGEVDEEIWGDGGWDKQDKEAVEEQEGWGDFLMGGGVVGGAGATAIGGSKLLAGTQSAHSVSSEERFDITQASGGMSNKKKSGKQKRRV